MWSTPLKSAVLHAYLNRILERTCFLNQSSSNIDYLCQWHRKGILTALAYSKEEKVLKNLHGNLQTFQYFDTRTQEKHWILCQANLAFSLFSFFPPFFLWINEIKGQVHGMCLPVLKRLYFFFLLFSFPPFFSFFFFLNYNFLVWFNGTHAVLALDHFHYSNQQLCKLQFA